MSDVTTIFEHIESKVGNSSFTLLYASTDKVSAKDFHDKCDAKGPTVTILYGKHNTIFGGYTCQDWSSPDTKQNKRDEHAFLFSKNDNVAAECVFMPVKQKHADKAITCNKRYGPTFGHKVYDLQTFKEKTDNAENDKKDETDKKASDKDKSDSEESDTKDGNIELNGKMNIGNSYDDEVFPNSKKASPADRGGPESKRTVTSYRIKKEDINSGKLTLRRIEVYQVVGEHIFEPWREKPTDEATEKMRKHLESLKPIPGLGIKQYNILLVGAVGSGKSSFCNTLVTAFAGSVKTPAPARGTASSSVTNKMRAYQLKSKDDNKLNLQVFDIRGFDDENGYVRQLAHLLKGELPNGYEYPEDPSAEVETIKSEGLKDEIHLVCFVTGTPNLELVTNDQKIRIKEIHEKVNKKGLPMVVAATKFDELCRDDADHIYQCPRAGDAINKISSYLGIERSHIFPIVNYVEDQIVNCGKDRLALQALDFMVRLIEDQLGTIKALDNRPDDWLKRATKLHIPKTNKEKEDLRLNVEEELTAFEDSQLRVLCVGAVSSGKTSFIDSIASTLVEKIIATACGGCTMTSESIDGSSESTTEKFQMFQMKYKKVPAGITKSNVYIGDIPGFQKSEGIRLEDVKYVVRGHVPNKYIINNGIDKNSEKIKKHPQKSDKVHCICFVFDVSMCPDKLPDNVRKTLVALVKWLNKRNVPFVAILTHCDFSDEVKTHTLNVFKDEVIYKRMNRLKQMFGFKQKRMFPVINYIDEEDVVPESDALLMEVFREILSLGKEYLDMSDDEDTDEIDEGQVPGASP